MSVISKMKQIAAQVDMQEKTLLSAFAFKNEQAFRKEQERDIHFRPPFALDRDRIFYSGAFRRYTGKTQVIYFVSLLDEQLTSRILHTLSVAQISKTIGRLLSLNTDLIEAIALGHDLGHPPFGHDGEKFLSEVSLQYDLGYFHHNIQSLRVVDTIAKKGRGLNLTFQTRDGILSHNGEVHKKGLTPKSGKNEKALQDYISRMEQGDMHDMDPGTLEGCVVRLTDTIAYIGQDIDDAIRIGLIRRDELPSNVTAVLGASNGEIVDALVNDVVVNSHGKNYVGFSEKISRALLDLKQFNYREIYKSPKLKINHGRIKKGFEILFAHYLQDVNEENKESEIYQHFLGSKADKYLQSTSPQLKVRDYLAGMTDRYFIKVLQKVVVPEAAHFTIFNE